VKVYTIGVGIRGNAPFPQMTPFGKRYVMAPVDIDEDTLTAIADKTGGKYYRADSTDTLKKVYAEIDQFEKSEAVVKKFVRREELFRWAAVPGLLAARRGSSPGTIWRLREKDSRSRSRSKLQLQTPKNCGRVCGSLRFGEAMQNPLSSFCEIRKTKTRRPNHSPRVPAGFRVSSFRFPSVSAFRFHFAIGSGAWCFFGAWSLEAWCFSRLRITLDRPTGFGPLAARATHRAAHLGWRVKRRLLTQVRRSASSEYVDFGHVKQRRNPLALIVTAVALLIFSLARPQPASRSKNRSRADSTLWWPSTHPKACSPTTCSRTVCSARNLPRSI
jgi:hypothetical protein